MIDGISSIECTSDQLKTKSTMKRATANNRIPNPGKQSILKAISMIGLALLSFQNIALASNDALDLFRKKRVLHSAQAFLDEGRREFTRGGYLRSIRVLTQAINKGADPEASKLRGQAYLSPRFVG